MYLLRNKTANTDGTQKKFYYSQPNDGQVGTLVSSGTFGGATIGLEIRMPGEDEWIAITDSQSTAAAAYILNGGSYQVRGSLTGATGTTDLTLQIRV